MQVSVWILIPKLIIWAFIVAVFVWDVIANMSGNHEATVSVFLLSTSRKYPIIAFLFGLLAGHAFWPNE
tara:strand:- start:107 stop:313 length:207 start_codon:yes stop_codon:yes gene_type:complete